jgi:hypothetical protein
LQLLTFTYVAAIQAAGFHIVSNEIHFRSGKILKFVPNKKDEKRIKKITEDPIVVNAWERLFLLQSKRLSEDDAYAITVYDFNGVLLNKIEKIYGEIQVHILQEKQRIFLGIRSSHFDARESLLLDKDGNILKKIHQQTDVFEFKVSDDHKIIWILSSSVQDQKAITKVNCYDTEGNEIKQFQTSTASTLELNHNGVKYTLSVPKPALPG